MKEIERGAIIKRNISKALIYCGFIFAFLFLLAIFPTWTPQIPGEDSISELKKIALNGTELAVMIRGHHKNNPVIIVVHGGPGCSEIPYIRKYQRELEKHFTIVHYDQRASGKSYRFFEDYSNLSPALLVEDLLALSRHISKRFDNKQIILIGHSYGTYISMQAIKKVPQLYQAYVGIGQVSDRIEGEIDNLNYCITQAQAKGNLSDVAFMEGLRSRIESGDIIAPRNYVRKYGGSARLINETKDMVEGFIFNSEYNLLDIIRYVLGVTLSQDVLMEKQFEAPITQLVDSVDIPTWFIMGQYDHMTSTLVAHKYYNSLSAPQKSFIVYDQSAHYPQLEENDRFTDWMIATFQ